MNPMRRGLVAQGAANAHADAHDGMTQTDAARRHSRSERTIRYWGSSGPPALKEVVKYMGMTGDPWRVAAWVDVEAKRLTVERFTDSQLVERIHELRQYEKQIEGIDNGMDANGCALTDSAAQKQRDAAVNAELSACLLEAAARPSVRARLEARHG